MKIQNRILTHKHFISEECPQHFAMQISNKVCEAIGKKLRRKPKDITLADFYEVLANYDVTEFVEQVRGLGSKSIKPIQTLLNDIEREVARELKSDHFLMEDMKGSTRVYNALIRAQVASNVNDFVAAVDMAGGPEGFCDDTRNLGPKSVPFIQTAYDRISKELRGKLGKRSLILVLACPFCGSELTKSRPGLCWYCGENVASCEMHCRYLMSGSVLSDLLWTPPEDLVADELNSDQVDGDESEGVWIPASCDG